MVDLLQEQVAAVVGALLALSNLFCWRILNHHLAGSLLLRGSQFCNILPGFANRIVFSKTGYEVMHGPKALDILGGILPVLFAVGLLDIVDGLGAPGKYAKRHDVFIMRY